MNNIKETKSSGALSETLPELEFDNELQEQDLPELKFDELPELEFEETKRDKKIPSWLELYFKEAQPALKLMIWDHNRNLAFHRANTVLSDPQAAQYVWGTAFHWYVGDNYDNIKRIHEAFPDKGLVFSEGCAYPFSWENVKQWNFGEKYGEAIIHDLNNNTNAWTDWNLILDEKGGPNHVENYCLAPIIADTRTGEVHYMSSYYYIGHFSKYIRPGAKRISCSSMTDDILATAFINPDNSIVLVMMNQTDNDIDINVWMDGKTAPTKMLAHSIVTCLIQKP